MDLACQHALSLCHEELMLVYNIVIILAQVTYTCIGMVHVSVNVTLLYQRELGMAEIIVISLAQIWPIISTMMEDVPVNVPSP